MTRTEWVEPYLFGSARVSGSSSHRPPSASTTAGAGTGQSGALMRRYWIDRLGTVVAR